jgi:coenzyme PQQ precursor peptide PqqA
MRDHRANDFVQLNWETPMAWKTPKIVEVPVGMEINMYACAARK